VSIKGSLFGRNLPYSTLCEYTCGAGAGGLVHLFVKWWWTILLILFSVFGRISSNNFHLCLSPLPELTRKKNKRHCFKVCFHYSTVFRNLWSWWWWWWWWWQRRKWNWLRTIHHIQNYVFCNNTCSSFVPEENWKQVTKLAFGSFFCSISSHSTLVFP